MKPTIQAISCQLTLHSVCRYSASALHLLHQGRTYGNLDIRCKTVKIAYEYHIKASSIFNSMKHEVTQHNWPIFLGFAVSIVVCQLAMQSTCPEPLFDYMEVFQVLRASRGMSQTLIGWLESSEVWPMIKQRTLLSEIQKMHDYGLSQALDLLQNTIHRSAAIGAGPSGCMFVAMQSLSEWVTLCEGRPRRWQQYIHWPSVVSESFVEALKAGDEFALILLLHWLAVLRLAPPRWFLEYWIIRTYRLLQVIH